LHLTVKLGQEIEPVDFSEQNQRAGVANDPQRVFPAHAWASRISRSSSSSVLKPLKPIKGLKKPEDMGDYLPSSEKESFTSTLTPST